MDATNQKRMAWGFTALMLGSLFVGVFVVPTAAAQTTSTNPTAAPDVIVNATQRRTEIFNVDVADGAESEVDVSIVTSPSNGIIESDVAYDFTLEGLETGAGAYGYLSGATTVYLVNRSSGAAISGGVATVYTTTGDFRAATFPGITFPGPGVYEARTTSPTGTVVARIFVHPNNDITVSIAPSSFPWTASGGTYTVTVTNSAGSGIEGVRLSGANIPSGTTTLSGGTRTIVAPLPGAGVFTIEAEIFRCLNGDPAQCSNANSQTFGGDRLPHVRNNATLTVSGAGLNMTAVATTAFVGFQNQIAFRPSFQDTNEVVGQKISGNLRTQLRDATDYINISVLTPGNVLIVANISNPQASSGTVNLATIARCRDLSLAATPTPGVGVWDANSLVSCTTSSAGLQASHGNVLPALWTLDMTTGDIAFKPGENTATLTDVWASGAYTFTVGANTEGALATAPEYSGTFVVTPASPAAVNLDFRISAPTTGQMATGTGGASGTGTPDRTPAAGTLDVLGPSNPAGATPLLQSYTLIATISGSAAAEHPGCRYLRTGTENVVAETGFAATTQGATTCAPGDDPGVRQSAGLLSAAESGAASTFRSNITLRGDLLPGWSVTSYTPSSGEATITGVRPTRNGTIWMDVTWKNVTTTLTIPVIRGVNVTADLVNMTVDSTNTLTVQVRASGGGAEPSAYVRVFQRDADGGGFLGTGTSELTGTNAAGRGEGGLYTFTLRPNAVQDLVVFASVGAGAAQNYSYYRLDVVPNQNLVTNLNVTQTMASLTTQFVLNVTNATQGFTQNSFRWYMLTPTDVRDLVNNGTSSLFDGTPAIGTCPTAGAAMTTSASCRVTPDATTAFGAVANLSLQPLDWRLYFCWAASGTGDCTAATHDNRQAMPTINVSAYTAVFNPTQIASSSDIQSNTVVNVRVNDRNGAPANGTLTVATAGLTTGATSTQITNGQGNITLTGTAIGTLLFNFDPTDPGTQFTQASLVQGNLSVIAGNLTFQPTRVSILQPTLVNVRLANFTGAGLPGRVIRLCGVALNSNFPSGDPPTSLITPTNIQSNCPAVGTTGADGATGIVVTPNALVPISVYINDSYTGRQIPVTAGTLTLTVSPTNPQAGGNVTFTVMQPGNVASAGARVLLVRDGTTVLDTTADGNGQATFSSLVAGNYTATATRTGFDNGTATFTVGPAPTTNQTTAVFQLSNLTLPSTITVGTPFNVGVTVTNVGNGSGSVQAQLLLNDVVAETEDVTLAAGASEDLTYTGIIARTAGTYRVVVRIGTVTTSQNITVSPAPTPTPTTTPVTTATPPVTTSTPPVTTSPTTPVTTATPPVTGSPTTTTPTPTEEAPDVPGFEVVALLAAMAIALLVLRRRKA